MTRWLGSTLVLCTIYLLVLGKAAWQDIVLGAVLSGLIAAGVISVSPPLGVREDRSLASRLAAMPGFFVQAAVDLVRATWQVAGMILGRRDAGKAGFVQVPIGERSRTGVVAWGLETGLSPDEIVVDIDLDAGTALLHVIDASDPQAVRVKHREVYDDRTSRVFP